jgi:monoamine oxidase
MERGNRAFSRDEPPGPQTDQLHLVLAELKWDRRSLNSCRNILRALSRDEGRGLRRGRPDGRTSGAGDEWMNSGRSAQARIVGGYGALIDFLTRSAGNYTLRSTFL